MKICTNLECKKEYPATTEYFYKDKTHKDGLSSSCKKCCYKTVNKYQQSKRGKIAHKQTVKKYQQTDKGKIALSQAAKKYCSTIRGCLTRVYHNIKQRCDNPKCKAYKNYGKRGIKNKFKSANELMNYVVNELRIDPRGLQIDRVDNGGNYEKGNIRFVTNLENLKNKG